MREPMLTPAEEDALVAELEAILAEYPEHDDYPEAFERDYSRPGAQDYRLGQCTMPLGERVRVVSSSIARGRS